VHTFVRLCPVLQCPVRQCPVRQCPVRLCPVRQCPVLHCPVLQCPTLRARPSMSSPAMSTPAKSSVIVQSCNVQPRFFTRPSMSSPANSVNPFELEFCMCMYHDHSSPGIESQGHRSRSKVNVQSAYGCDKAVTVPASESSK